MKRESLVLSALLSALFLSAGFALAADPEPAKETAQTQKQDRVYGSQLMTQEERVEYRAKMRTVKTAEEREQFRMEHHEQMKERAQARGVKLPDEPPVRGGGMGSSGGMGSAGGMGSGGMGSGGGMGPGGGKGTGGGGR